MATRGLLRCLTLCSALLLLCCAQNPANTLSNETYKPVEDDEVMSQDAKYINEFNVLYSAIQAASKQKALENYLDEAVLRKTDWLQQTGHHPAMLESLWAILYDEIDRKNEQLRNKPGRQKAPDWQKKFDAHHNRLEKEFEVLQELRPGNTYIDTCIGLLSESMRLSIELIDVDQQQLSKQNIAGRISLSEDQERQLQSALHLSKEAVDFLRVQISD